MRSIAILTYHSLDESGSVVSISPQVFSAQMAGLVAKGLRAMSLQNALDYRERHAEWPDNSVILTFDDGFSNVDQHALPVLLQYGFTGTVFFVAGHAGGTSSWHSAQSGMGTQALLSWEQAGRLMESGVEIGAHGVHHVDMLGIGADAIEEEIGGSVELIRSHLGRPPLTFAYPYGSVSRIATETAGRHFRACCTTVHRRTSAQPYQLLPRIEMYYFRNCRDICALALGRLDAAIMLRRWMRVLRRRLVRQDHSMTASQHRDSAVGEVPSS